jgi:hypothetical protein
MNRHTKGPWHVGVGNGEGSIFADEGRSRLELGGTTLYPICQINSGWDEGEDAANARLIAALPDLFAALQMVDRIWSQDQTANLPPDSPVAIVRAAIAKATGQGEPR